MAKIAWIDTKSIVTIFRGDVCSGLFLGNRSYTLHFGFVTVTFSVWGCLFEYCKLVLVEIVAWIQKGNATVCRNILLFWDRRTFHERSLASAESWCHSSLFPLYGQLDLWICGKCIPAQKNLVKVLVGPKAWGENVCSLISLKLWVLEPNRAIFCKA